MWYSSSTCVAHGTNLLTYRFHQAYTFDEETARKMIGDKIIINMCEKELPENVATDRKCSESLSGFDITLVDQKV